MSDDQNEPVIEPVEQVVPSLDEKLAEINAQLLSSQEATNQQIQTLAQQMQAMNQPAPVQTETPNDFYDLNPSEYKEQIKKEAVSETRELMANEMRKQQELNTTAVNLSREYPEIADASSDMYKQVVAIHSKLPKDIQETSAGYELAVRQAAAIAGLLPKNKRQQSASDDFSISGSQPGSKPATGGKSKVNDKVLATAQLMGIDITNKDALKRLEANQKKFGV